MFRTWTPIHTCKPGQGRRTEPKSNDKNQEFVNTQDFKNSNLHFGRNRVKMANEGVFYNHAHDANFKGLRNDRFDQQNI